MVAEVVVAAVEDIKDAADAAEEAAAAVVVARAPVIIHLRSGRNCLTKIVTGFGRNAIRKASKAELNVMSRK